MHYNKIMDKVEIVIIGAGVVGLAIAAELSKKSENVVLLEIESAFGQGTSSRNSEVIHAGIYYPKDSLKAKLCVDGNRLLYKYCEENAIPHKRIGKLIVAQNENEFKGLKDLEKKAIDNGVNDLVWLDPKQIKAMEPSLNAYAALFSPSTGIIDSHSLMKSLENQAKANGVLVSYNSGVTGIKKVPDGYEIEINGEDKILSEKVINSAGLYSDKISAMVGIDIEKAGYKLHYCKGEYFSYNKPSFLTHLVYPVPEQDIKGLGIHSVIDLAGGLKFGPSAEYVDKIDYLVDPSHRKIFYKAICDMFPQISEVDLSPDQAGMRPKLQGPGDRVKDFVIKEESDRGYPGFVNLIGIESPGLTSCLRLARGVINLCVL